MTEPRPQGTEASDLELIARWRGGDELAATRLVERHGQAIARFLASLGAGGETEDLVQDTLVRAFSSLDGYRGESGFRTWLFTIARNLLRDRARAARRELRLVPVEEHHAVTSHDAQSQSEADETEARLRAALGRLTPMQREVFTLRVTEGMGYREIAEVTGSTEGAARVHYYNAVRAIKEWLDD